MKPINNFKECVKKQMSKGYEREEAEEICRDLEKDSSSKGGTRDYNESQP